MTVLKKSRALCMHDRAADETGKCSQCFFERNESRLLDEFPWLERQGSSFGCSACRQFYKGKPLLAHAHGGAWRETAIRAHTALQPRALQKHADSQEHQAATEQVTDADHRSPSYQDFHKVLAHLRKETVGRAGVSGVAGHKKTRRMAWCLAEASRRQKHELWRSGSGADGLPILASATLFQDARAGKLSIRFTAANSAMQKRSGHMYTVDLKDFSTDSIGLMKATMFALKAFCALGLHPPYLDPNRQCPVPDENFHVCQRLLASVEMFCSDAASDEIRAGHMLAGQDSVHREYLPKLPNLKLVVRDRPHAVRRVLTRGWKPCGFMENVSSCFVTSKSSPVNKIQHSHIFQNMFAVNIKNLDADLKAVRSHPHIKDLSYAPHRFESTQQPLARIVLFFHAFILTVTQIAWERKHEDVGKEMAQFMHWLDDEKCLMAAMMADGATEATELLRLMDYQGFPVDELGDNVVAFKDRIRKLFFGAEPACLATGFTSHMIKLLAREHLFTFPGPRGQSHNKTIGRHGGPPAQMIQNCLQRLAAWVVLAETTLDAELLGSVF